MALTRATIEFTGLVIWEPPAIYKSSYILNVEFYPFDQQECGMKFGSWTFDASQVILFLFLSKNPPKIQIS